MGFDAADLHAFDRKTGARLPALPPQIETALSSQTQAPAGASPT
jgi:hypothetical protein